jgi:hypothetical protein
MCNLKYAFFCLVLWPVILLRGQEINYCECNSMLDSLIEPKLFGDLYQPQKNGVGSQYYIKEWLNGDIYLTNGNIIKNNNLRYNGFLDRLMWITPISYQQVKLDKEQIKGFCLNDKYGTKYNYEKILIKDEFSPDSFPVYGEVLYKNRISLVAYRKVALAGYNVVPGGSYYEDVYKLSNSYLFKLENGKTLGFKRFRKRDISKLFPDKTELIVNKFRELKQRQFRTEADLIRVTKALNDFL